VAKGQVRGNKEAKKPKQDKKPSTPITPSGSSAARAGTPIDTKKK
jgi:hypothetical protein